MRSQITIPIILALIAGIMTAPLAVATEEEVKLKIRSPLKLKENGLMLSDDWALIIEMQAVDAVGMVDEDLPRSIANKALVLSDPDGCVDMRDWVELGLPGSPFETGCAGQDELFVKFNTDPSDMPGLQDSSGSGISQIDGNLRLALQNDPFVAANVANLNVQYATNGFSGAPAAVGAATEGFDPNFVFEPLDGFGYGVNDDWPGLFVWAEVGSGVVRDTDLVPILNANGGLKLRNMAGLINGVYYTHFAKDNKTSIVSVMSIDRGTLEPIIQFDFNIDPQSGSATGFFDRRIDGGTIERIPFSDPIGLFGQNAAFTEVYNSLEPFEVTVYAILVEGQAAAFVEDVDGNGKINKNDFETLGYNVLSNRARYQLRAIAIEGVETGAFECPEVRVFREADFDNSALFGIGCSTGNARSLVRRPQ